MANAQEENRRKMQEMLTNTIDPMKADIISSHTSHVIGLKLDIKRVEDKLDAILAALEAGNKKPAPKKALKTEDANEASTPQSEAPKEQKPVKTTKKPAAEDKPTNFHLSAYAWYKSAYKTDEEVRTKYMDDNLAALLSKAEQEPEYAKKTEEQRYIAKATVSWNYIKSDQGKALKAEVDKDYAILKAASQAKTSLTKESDI